MSLVTARNCCAGVYHKAAALLRCIILSTAQINAIVIDQQHPYQHFARYVKAVIMQQFYSALIALMPGRKARSGIYPCKTCAIKSIKRIINSALKSLTTLTLRFAF
ncbi:hypothetical protein [Pantoea dispersa]|uniref:hypothetical protein n=1 Tax=Pantoea dispersa TaxID=59814 RepID=UPI00123A030F|nr:hypothetical protein [Pantoea dispersa]KAA8672534.1 hypothetical protein F4W08_06230 [Pantoea dispersa]